MGSRAGRAQKGEVGYKEGEVGSKEWEEAAGAGDDDDEIDFEALQRNNDDDDYNIPSPKPWASRGSGAIAWRAARLGDRIDDITGLNIEVSDYSQHYKSGYLYTYYYVSLYKVDCKAAVI